jgi:hypothetical protein
MDKVYEDVSPLTANAPIGSVASNQKKTSVPADIGSFKLVSRSEFSNRGNPKFNSVNKSKRRRYIHRDKNRNATTYRKQKENYGDNEAQRSLIFRKDASKVAAKLFFKDNLKKTLNLARTQRNGRTKRIKPSRYRRAKISRKNSYAPNVIRPKTNSYADYPASRKFI